MNGNPYRNNGGGSNSNNNSSNNNSNTRGFGITGGPFKFLHPLMNGSVGSSVSSNNDDLRRRAVGGGVTTLTGIASSTAAGATNTTTGVVGSGGMANGSGSSVGGSDSSVGGGTYGHPPLSGGAGPGQAPTSTVASSAMHHHHSRSHSNRVRFPSYDDDDDDEHDGHDGPLEIFAGIVTALIASVCVAGLTTILVVLYVTVHPFSPAVYRRLAAQIGAASFLDAVALLLPNIRINLTGDSDVPSPVGTSVLVSNHLIDGDWWGMLMLGRCVGLRGSIKVFLRNEYLHINLQNASGDQSPTSSAAAAAVTARSLVPSAAGNTVNTATTQSATTSSPTSAHNSSSSLLAVSSTTGITTTMHHHPHHHAHHHAHTSSTNPPSPSSNTNTNTNSSGSSSNTNRPTGELAIMAKLLHLFLEFPLLNGEDYISDREQLFQLLRSFAEHHGSAAPVHLLFYPEGWSLHHCTDRRQLLAKSNEFAQREGRPQLKHLLLPRTRGFNASLECLRESSPVVYDVTMAYSGYDGSLPPSISLSMCSIWHLLRRKFPREIHIRIKRYSFEEVLHDSSWLDKKWAEKDRLLSHFSRHQSFPVDNRGYCRYRVFNTRHHSVESSIMSLIRLMLLPCAVPVLLALSIPLLWTILWMWLANKAFRFVFPDDHESRAAAGDGQQSLSSTGQTPGSASAGGTPFFPATPFATPSTSSWRDMINSRNPREHDATN